MINRFPWKYFLSLIRARLFLIFASFFLYLALENYGQGMKGAGIFFIILILAVLAIYHAYITVKPMQKILKKINHIFMKLPSKKFTEEFYHKNEWEIIDHMLDLTADSFDSQKEAYENQLIQSDTLIESIPTATVIVDKFLNCKQYNQLFLQHFIRNKNIKIVNAEKFWKVFENIELENLFKEVIDQDHSKHLSGFYFNDLNEFFDISVTPLRDRNKKIIGALGIFHNVTQAKLMEKMRVDFVANVSHEIRTPLTSVKGYAQLLKAQEKEFPEKLVPILDKINNNTERLKDLFDNLLKLSVIESQHEINKEIISLEKLLLNIKSNLSAKYLNQPFSFSLELNEKDILGDEKLLEQVFTNLLDNAIKYAGGSPKIKISSFLDNDFVYIHFSDNGPGIPAVELPRIFERFYRTAGGISKPVEGTGLGLSIVKHIINKHHGKITVESQANAGTTFIIKLPNS